MNNYNIAKELLEIETLLELNDKTTVAKDFEHSALSILVLDRPVLKMQSLNFLPEAVRDEIISICEFGYSPLKESLEAKTPKVLKQLLSLPGIRTRDILRIYNLLKIDSATELEKLLREGVIRKTFGEKFEEHLRRALIHYGSSKKELGLFYAYGYANTVKMALESLGDIEVAGSVRRGKEVVNNIDFVYDFEEEKLLKEVTSTFSISSFTRRGNLITCKDTDNIQLKFFKVPKAYFFSGLQYYTGSKQHNKIILEIAKAKGFEIAKEGFALIKADSENEFYERLSLEYIPPEIREGEEEIDLAISFSIPKLVSLSDMKGDLHMHTTFSDGSSSVFEMYEEANLLGYEYIAITDHSKSLRIANGLSRNSLLKEIEIIDRINADGLEPVILKGIEAEIGPHGEVDIDEDMRPRLDLVIGGLHQFSSTNFENTERVKKAIKSSIINIVAHPTNRIIFLRKSIEVDIGTIFEEAYKNDVALEVNLFPNRMDLNTGLIKEARRAKVKFFSVGTDAHNRGHLHFMKYGIKILRRAWVRSEEILNSYSLEALKELLWTKTH
jgi:DNA polymerase (family 10)